MNYIYSILEANPGLYVDETQQKLFETLKRLTDPTQMVEPEVRGRTGRDRGHVGGGCIVWDGLRHAANDVKNVRKGDRNEETSSCSLL